MIFFAIIAKNRNQTHDITFALPVLITALKKILKWNVKSNEYDKSHIESTLFFIRIYYVRISRMNLVKKLRMC